MRVAIEGELAPAVDLVEVRVVDDDVPREAREVGEKAVQYAMWGDAGGRTSGSVAIRRTGFYSVDYELLPLAQVAGRTRVMDDAFIADSGAVAGVQLELPDTNTELTSDPGTPGVIATWIGARL